MIAAKRCERCGETSCGRLAGAKWDNDADAKCDDGRMRPGEWQSAMDALASRLRTEAKRR